MAVLRFKNLEHIEVLIAVARLLSVDELKGTQIRSDEMDAFLHYFEFPKAIPSGHIQKFSEALAEALTDDEGKFPATVTIEGNIAIANVPYNAAAEALAQLELDQLNPPSWQRAEQERRAKPPKSIAITM